MSDETHSSRFEDGKAPDAMRTIGEVARALGIKQHVLRYWEQQFPMLRPLQRSGGRRYYRPEDIALVQRLDRLINHEGYTLKGARQVMEADNVDRRDERTSTAADRSLLPQLRAVRDRLARALEAA